MRGKHLPVDQGCIYRGNIPAYAGKTSQVIEGEYQVTGTSPRMRGKREFLIPAQLGDRNIPAYAGKTPAPRVGARHHQEHPRVCGENSAFPYGIVRG